VCEVDGRVVATFAFLPGPDECYDVIEDGQWRSDTPYAVLHRVASDGTVHGIAAAMFAFAKERADHLRIDTHQDNLPMQGAIAKAGFKRAGIVYVSDGTPRVAFDWLREA
jgi:GNAT superfamily N-acetyltransferase